MRYELLNDPMLGTVILDTWTGALIATQVEYAQEHCQWLNDNSEVL